MCAYYYFTYTASRCHYGVLHAGMIAEHLCWVPGLSRFAQLGIVLTLNDPSGTIVLVGTTLVLYSVGSTMYAQVWRSTCS